MLLAIQLGLLFYTNSGGNRFEPFSPDAPLFEFAPESVSSLVFTDGSNEKLTLEKTDGKWHIAVQQKPPASETQVTQLLEKLAELKESLAIATSKEAQKRFKVTKDHFEYHFVALQGDTVVADLYLGTSPGFRQVHGRVAGQEKVLSLPLNGADFVPTLENWIDKELLHVAEDELQGVKMKGYSVERSDGSWMLAGMETQTEADDEEIQRLIDKVSALSIQSIAETTSSENAVPEDPDLEFVLVLGNGTELSYTFKKMEDGSYLLWHSDYEPVFIVQEWVVNAIMEITKEKLLAETDNASG